MEADLIMAEGRITIDFRKYLFKQIRTNKG
jgi:hypothetical protein